MVPWPKRGKETSQGQVGRFQWGSVGQVFFGGYMEEEFLFFLQACTE